jgi:hypothetical protein
MPLVFDNYQENHLPVVVYFFNFNCDILILDDFDDHGLIEEPVPKHASVFVDKWVSYINKMLENTDGAIKNGQFYSLNTSKKKMHQIQSTIFTSSFNYKEED